MDQMAVILGETVVATSPTYGDKVLQATGGQFFSNRKLFDNILRRG